MRAIAYGDGAQVDHTLLQARGVAPVRGVRAQEMGEPTSRQPGPSPRHRVVRPRYLHWECLHEAANEARERVSKLYAQMDEIDRNAGFSRDGKYRQRCETAAQAIADFEASKTLARAREAVELAVAKRNSSRTSRPRHPRQRGYAEGLERG